MIDKETVLFMTQSIPRAFVRHLSFFIIIILEKLQMPHGGV